MVNPPHIAHIFGGNEELEILPFSDLCQDQYEILGQYIKQFSREIDDTQAWFYTKWFSRYLEKSKDMHILLQKNAHFIRIFCGPPGGGGPKVYMADHVNGSSTCSIFIVKKSCEIDDTQAWLYTKLFSRYLEKSMGMYMYCFGIYKTQALAFGWIFLKPQQSKEFVHDWPGLDPYLKSKFF